MNQILKKRTVSMMLGLISGLITFKLCAMEDDNKNNNPILSREHKRLKIIDDYAYKLKNCQLSGTKDCLNWHKNRTDEENLRVLRVQYTYSQLPKICKYCMFELSLYYSYMLDIEKKDQELDI